MPIALVTGVGRPGQVGEALARTFAAAGWTLVLVDRTAAQAEARARDLVDAGFPAAGYGCDLTRPDDVARLAQRVRREQTEALDALVHAAGGFAASGPVAESDVAVWERQIGINLTSAYLATRAFLPLVRAARGALLYFASEAVLAGGHVAELAAYAAAKNGVVALMRAVAQEEAARASGVRANALAPAAIRTAANEQAMGAETRYVEREDVAATALYLCSAAASAITAQVIALS